MIDKETLDVAMTGLKGMGELAKEGATTLVDEVVKLYIFYGVMGILKAAVVFIVFGIVLKFINAVDPDKTNKILGATRSAALVLSIIYFTVNSMPHLLDMGKAMVAPNLFLAEKGIELVKKDK